MTHTPGPWYIENNTSFDYVGDFILSADSDRGVIAETRCVDSVDVTAEDRANARLIAAAPELLEAAEAVIAEVHASGKLRTNAQLDLSNAINKAKGGTE